MAGDYSRTTFDPAKHFSAVRLQQGRLRVDADHNEQGDIVTHYLRALAEDLIGPYGGPGDGFTLAPATTQDGGPDFTIAPGRYYVGGILCENDAPAPVPFSRQPDFVPGSDALADGRRYLAYLDVWEREITYLEDDDIRDVALGGPDTAARLRVVWQVHVIDVSDDEFDEDDPDGFLTTRRPTMSTARLQARALQEDPPAEPCTLSFESRYRGPENQLYRVQIHAGGGPAEATFVWSRDNASARLAVTGTTDDAVLVEDLGRDARLSVKGGDWVELVDDTSPTGRLLKVREADPYERRILVEENPGPVDPDRQPILRRWDQGHGEEEGLVEGAVPVQEGEWLELEDGVQIRFEGSEPSEEARRYQPGDFWQIPARVETGDVDWPGPVDDPQSRSPGGVRHRLAPLRLLQIAGSDVGLGRDYRRVIEPVARPLP